MKLLATVKQKLAQWWDDNAEMTILALVLLAVDGYVFHIYLDGGNKTWGYVAVAPWFLTTWGLLYGGVRRLIEFISKRMDNTVPGCLLYVAFSILSFAMVVFFIFSDSLWDASR